MENSVYMVNWCLKSDQTDLSGPERSIVHSALRHFDKDRYELYAFVVMNDHVHVMFKPLSTWTLESIIQSWKSFTANRMQRIFGRTGIVWQDEYFDRIIRNQNDYEEKLKYILENPARRWPGLSKYHWVGLGQAGANAVRNRELDSVI